MIYLDNNATTFVDPEVFEVIKPLFTEQIGNPSSIHQLGQKAKGILHLACTQIADYFDVTPQELYFFSGATEALNMLIKSAPKKSHIITSSMEHIAVIESLRELDCSVSYLDPIPGKGAITAEQIREAIQENTSMIVIMAVNNETGIKTDIEAIAALAQERGLLLVVDGVAWIGKESFSIPPGVSAICFSGHKFHAPQGIALAIIRKSFKCKPLIVGGSQQRGVRGGTENLYGIVALAKAIERLTFYLPGCCEQMTSLRNYLEEGLATNLPSLIIHGKEESRICNTSNIAFLGCEGESLLINLDLAGVCVSQGPACSSGNLSTSRVLLQMGLDARIARSSIRFSLSRMTTKEEIERTILIVTKIVKQLMKN